MKVKAEIILSKEEIIEVIRNYITEEFRYRSYDRPPGKVVGIAVHDDGTATIYFQVPEPELAEAPIEVSAETPVQLPEQPL